MQPDLLTAEREEEQAPSASLPLPDADTLESIPVPPVIQPSAPRPAQKKRSRLNLAVLGLVLFGFLLLLSFGWVGYWAYTLNNELMAIRSQLTASQADYTKLQAEYATLKSDNEKLSADLTQSRADLEKANTDLATAQTDLDTSKTRNKELTDQVDTASNLSEILYALATLKNESAVLKIDRLVNEANNNELTKQWNSFTDSPSEDAFSSFLEYLIFATRESLR